MPERAEGSGKTWENLGKCDVLEKLGRERKNKTKKKKKVVVLVAIIIIIIIIITVVVEGISNSTPRN